MLASVTLLPALLGFAGLRINAFAIRLPGGKGRSQRRAVQRAEQYPGLPADVSPRFAAWSRGVQRRPWVAAIVGLALIALIASPVPACGSASQAWRTTRSGRRAGRPTRSW
jgi:RND superfamily putative drug exporter